jgi:hypothetical protein
MGEQVLDLRMYRKTGKYIYTFTPRNSRQMNIEFSPSFPAGTIFKNVLLNGKELTFASFQSPDHNSLVIKFPVADTSSIEVIYDKGISVLPIIQDPKPGYPAEGLRIIASHLKGNKYIMELEGRSGTSEEIKVFLRGQEIESIENGEMVEYSDSCIRIKLKFGNNGLKYNRRSVVIILK